MNVGARRFSGYRLARLPDGIQRRNPHDDPPSSERSLRPQRQPACRTRGSPPDAWPRCGVRLCTSNLAPISTVRIQTYGMPWVRVQVNPRPRQHAGYQQSASPLNRRIKGAAPAQCLCAINGVHAASSRLAVTIARRGAGAAELQEGLYGSYPNSHDVPDGAG